MSPVYASMRCVDNALIGQQGQHKVATRGKGGDEVQTRDVLFDQALPDTAGAHLAQGQGYGMSEHRDRIRRSFLCLYEEMGKLLRGVVCVVLRTRPNILNGESVSFNRHYMNVKRTAKIFDSLLIMRTRTTQTLRSYAPTPLNKPYLVASNGVLLTLVIAIFSILQCMLSTYQGIPFPKPASSLHHLPATIEHHHY